MEHLTDDQLIDLVQRQSLRFFWDFAHPVSFMARDRSASDTDPGNDVTVAGGSGMGAMAIIVGVERGWLDRSEAAANLLKMVYFLLSADHYHGVLGHFVHGATGKTFRFGRKDDAADIVETGLLVQGLLTVRQYFDRDTPTEKNLRNAVNQLWHDVEWDWHTKGGQNILFWHWSPNHDWSLGHEVRGWNECLITYVLAASSPRYAISPDAYHWGYAQAREFLNQRNYYDIYLPLGPELGGPLFFAHYSFLGIDPRGLSDRYADYWAQNVAHTKINHAYCAANPKGFNGYSATCWGLTASDDDRGYDAHSPTNDTGVISPTAALSSFPYTPELSMAALRHFYEERGTDLWRRWGFVDAFNPSANWNATTHLAIDQAPIVVMIENWRSGLLWKLFMSCPEIQTGLTKLGFSSPHLH